MDAYYHIAVPVALPTGIAAGLGAHLLLAPVLLGRMQVRSTCLCHPSIHHGMTDVVPVLSPVSGTGAVLVFAPLRLTVSCRRLGPRWLCRWWGASWGCRPSTSTGP